MKKIDLSVTLQENPQGKLYNNDLFIYQGNWTDEDPEQFYRLDVLSVCYVERGWNRLSLNSKEIEVRQGEVLVCRTNDIMSRLKYSENFHATFIYASMDIISCYLDPIRFNRCLQYIQFNPIIRLDSAGEELLQAYSRLLTTNIGFPYNDHSESTVLVAKAMLIDIFKMIPTEYEISAEKKMSRPQHLYQEFINLLSGMPQKSRDVACYAEKLTVSPKYLSYICKQQSGKTAKEWLMDYIMNDAERYLIGSKLTVKEIAVQLGFNNFAFFCKTIKQYFGKTPLEIRNRQKMP